MTPDRIVTLFKNAGFEKIKIVEKLIDVGDWRGGSLLDGQELTSIDPETADVGRAAIDAFAFVNVLSVLVDNFAIFIPDKEERRRWGDRAIAEFSSGKYPLLSKCYMLLRASVDSRYMITAWKPSVEV